MPLRSFLLGRLKGSYQLYPLLNAAWCDHAAFDFLVSLECDEWTVTALADCELLKRRYGWISSPVVEERLLATLDDRSLDVSRTLRLCRVSPSYVLTPRMTQSLFEIAARALDKLDLKSLICCTGIFATGSASADRALQRSCFQHASSLVEQLVASEGVDEISWLTKLIAPTSIKHSFP